MAITRLGLNDPELSDKPATLISVVLSVSLAITVLTIILFSWIATEMREGDTTRFDDNVRSFVHSFSSPATTKFMFAMSFMGAGGLVIMLIAAVVLCLMKKWYRAIGWLALTLVGAGILSVTLKFGFHRARPEAFFGTLPHSYSFPSGHALFSFCFFGVMAGLINARVRSLWLRALVFCAAAIMIALIGLSRIYLGVHYPSDVIAGYLTGAIWVSTMITMDRIHKTRRGLKIDTVADPPTQ